MNRPAPSDEWVATVVHDKVATPWMHNVQHLALPLSPARPRFRVWADFERTMPHSSTRAGTR
jgi:hypothetical protein